MKKVIAILLLPLFFYTLASRTCFDTIKRHFENSVAKPCLDAIETFAYQILKPVADISEPEKFGKEEYVKLKSAVNHFHNLLTRVETTLKRLVNVVNQNIERRLTEQEEIKKRLTSLEEEREKILIEKADVMKNLNETRIKMEYVNSTLRDISAAWDRNNNQRHAARNCIAHRRKRFDFLSFFGFGAAIASTVFGEDPKIKKVTDEIFNSPCTLINKGPIDSSFNRMAQAENEFKQYFIMYEQLKDSNMRLNAKVGELILKIVMNKNKKRRIKFKLDASRKILNMITNISVAVKQVLTHISPLQAQSNVLKIEVEYLIDISNLIIPLRSVSDKLVDFTKHYPWGFDHSIMVRFETSADIYATINGSIAKIQGNLHKYPLMDFNL